MKAWLRTTAERTRSDLHDILKNFREGAIAILATGMIVGAVVGSCST